MITTFQIEGWEQYYSDPRREVLWREHYAELEPSHQGRMAMGPNLEVYRALDRAGQLMVVVAREAGEMVGYTVTVIRPHMHYPTLCGFEDAYYLTPSSRRGSVGYRLILETLKHQRKRGCRKTFWMTKEFASVAKLFQRLGMVKCDEVWTMWLED